MAILIFLIIVDLIMIGVVMYFVVTEKSEHRDHYVSDHGNAPDTAPPPAPTATQTRDWAVQTTSDTEADTPTSPQEVVEKIEEAAQDQQGLDPIHEERLPDDAEPITLSEAFEQAAEEPEAPLNEPDPEDKDKA